jgi:hypothetical protein
MALRKTTETPSYRFERHHPALQTGQHLTLKNQSQNSTCTFTQSDFDSACGLHCLAMALAILNLAKGCALQYMSTRQQGLPAQVWTLFKDTYFIGIEPRGYVALIKQLTVPLSVAARYKGDRDLDSFAIKHLMRGDLVALCFKSIAHSRTRHWALGVAVSGEQHGRAAVADTLLLLDPSCRTEPSFSVSNARLRLPTHGAGSRQARSSATRTRPLMWLYDSSEWSPELVCLTGAVRLRRSDI